MQSPRLVHPDLRSLVARATLLSERLEARALGADAAGLTRWERALSGGQGGALERRLAWDGLDADAAAAPVVPPEDGLPAWAETLAELMEAVRAASEAPAAGDAAIPFRDLLLPMVAVARRRLAARVAAEPPGLFSAETWSEAERLLLRRLSTVATPTLHAEFTRARPALDPLLLHLQWEVPPTPPDGHHRGFVERHRADGMAALLDAYPVLGRLLARVVELWVEGAAELAARVSSDHAALAASFGGGAPLGGVREALPLHSDPHHGGRAVWALAFESGVRVVYKPRPVAMEAAWSGVIRWRNERSAGPALLAPVVLPRVGYGWMEMVDAAPCDEEEDASRFYHRAGSLLALVHLLAGTDCHHENLIAAGEHPVLVDTETLAQPDVRLVDEEARAAATVQLRVSGSVLRTGFLPRWVYHEPVGAAVEVSALGGVSEETVPVEGWEAVDTDWMRRVRRLVRPPAHPNVPRLGGEPLAADRYADEIVAGFAATWRLLAERKTELLAEDGPLAPFAALPVRFVFRPTSVYQGILRRALSPESLRDGLSLGIGLESLRRPFLRLPDRPDVWPLLHDELVALERLDVPYVHASTDSDALRTAGGAEIPRYFERSGWEMVKERVRELTEPALAYESLLIRGSLAASVARAGPPPLRPALDDEAAAPVFDADAALRAAVGIAGALGRAALRDDDGHAYWLGMTLVPGADRLQFAPIGESLYDGACGVALFLAALDRTLGGGTEHGELARAALRPVRRHLRHAPGADSGWFARRLGPGGALGVGSLVYAFTRCADLLREPALLDDASAAAALLTPALIADDRALDVVRGSAGAILGLLALHAATGDARALETAARCGAHLLEHRVETPDGRAWLTSGPRPLAGFSHGAAGIALALARLHGATGDPALLDAAAEAVGFERARFDPAVGNWRDLRGETPGFRSAWCHGAPGIGLARLGGLAWLDSAAVRRDLDDAIAHTLATPVAPPDHLCCGSLGRAELLLEAGLADAARSLAAAVLARAERAGGFALLPGVAPSVPQPGFFQGSSGIGYQLLRLRDPARLAPVLLWR